MLPKGWMKTTLGQLVDFSQGIQVDVEQQYASMQHGQVRFLRISDFVNKSESPRYIDNPGERFIVNETDLSMIRYGSSSAGDIVSGLSGAIANNLFRVTPKSSATSNDFLAYYLRQDNVKHFIFTNSSSSTMPAVSFGLVSQVPILVPPLPEQRKIAQILSTWDKAIATTERLLANKQQQKKALMQRLLTGNQRFAGFEGEWKTVSIKQLGTIASGGTPDTTNPDYWNGDVYWLTPTDVTSTPSRFITDTERKITESGMKNSSATLLPAGSLMVCTRATIGWMAISTTPITTNQGFKNVIPSPEFDVGFLYYLFSYKKDVFIRLANGSTFLELSKRDFENIKLQLPRLEEQKTIASVLSAADSGITTTAQLLENLKQQKKALMQQLLTGKRRVKVDEVAA